jgi:1-acyl-sn-glycerol-3-phosphate acyltransferase
MTFYQWIYNTLEPAVSALYRIEAHGVENIPADGAIVASNHTSFADVLVISAAAKRQVRYMAKKELFKIPLLAPLIKALGAYPVNRGGPDVSSIKRTIELIEGGELIGIFPQGHRYGGQDPRTTEIKAGIGMITYRTKAPVVPVFLDGKSGKTRMFRKNVITFGEPIRFEELEFVKGGMTEYTRASQIIFNRICEIKYGKSELPAGDRPSLPEKND